MRHKTVKDAETPLTNENMADRSSRANLTHEALDTILLRARQMRAEATAQLLSRLGAAIVRAFRQSAPSKQTGSNTAINREPHGVT